MGAAYATSPSTLGWILGATVRNHDSTGFTVPVAQHRCRARRAVARNCKVLYDCMIVESFIVEDKVLSAGDMMTGVKIE